MLMKAPEKHGFDAARLNRIPAFLKERYLDSGKLPNAQILISRDGEIVNRFRSKIAPDSEEMVKAIESELAKTVADSKV